MTTPPHHAARRGLRARIAMGVAALPLVAVLTTLPTALTAPRTQAVLAPQPATTQSQQVIPFQRLPVTPPQVPRGEDRTVAHVVHVSVDGVNATMLADLLATDPVGADGWHRLVTEGASTFNARTDHTRTDTLPNHTSMLTARPVERPVGMAADVHHGRTTNTDPAPGETVHDGNPHLGYLTSTFDVVHDHGLSTAAYVSKSKFSVFDVSYDADNGAPDTTGPDDGTDKIDTFVYDSHSHVMHARMLEDLAAEDFAYTFVHYLDPDAAGHGFEWGSAMYLDALRRVGGHLAGLLTMIEGDPQLAGQTAVIVTSDHGGGSPPNSHGNAQAPENHTVPVIVWGPGVAAGADLYALNPRRLDPGQASPAYSDPAQPIRNGDTGTLALDLLGLPPIPGTLMDDPLRVADADMG